MKRTQMEIPEFKFLDDHKIIGPRGKEDSGWNLELNRIIWDSGKTDNIKYDIRTWNADHTRMGKGISITSKEAQKLRDILNETDFSKDDMSSKIFNYDKYENDSNKIGPKDVGTKLDIDID